MRLTAHLVLYVLTVLGVSGGVGWAQSTISPMARGPIPIGDCTTITAPGSYVLVRNVTATPNNMQQGNICIAIAADFVSLDLAGFSVTNAVAAGYVDGIVTTTCCNRKGIAVRSGTVRNFSNNGVVLQGAGMVVENVRALDNRFAGISVGSGLPVVNGHRVQGNVAIGNSYGIVVYCPAVVMQNAATANEVFQIETNMVSGVCTAVDNSPAP